MNTTDQWDAVSRHGILRICAEMRAKYLTAPPPDLPPQRRWVVEAAARAAVLDQGWSYDPVAISRFCPVGVPPNRTELRGLARAVKQTVPTIRDLDTQVAPWTGGFWLGLRLSGALSEWRGRYRLLPGRPWLEEDVERLPVAGRHGPPSGRGRWLGGCLAASLPPASELGADVLAGLLAGARRHEEADGTWLTVRRSNQARRLLGWYGVSVVEGPVLSLRGAGRLGLWISPFLSTGGR